MNNAKAPGIHAKLQAAKQRVKRHGELDKLLDEFDWAGAGYASKWEWLADKFGSDMPNEALLERFYAEVEETPE